MAGTLRALADAGTDVTLVSPAFTRIALAPPGIHPILVRTAPRSWPHAALRSVRSGRPVSIERHAIPAVVETVAALIRCETFDIVHIEQPQALASAAPAREAGLPCVLRTQNLESAVWATAAHSRNWSAPFFRLEARRVRRFEAEALHAVDVTIALSSSDAAQLSALAPSARIIVVPPPASAPTVEEEATAAEAGPSATATLDGDPPFTWIGSSGWILNDEARRWMIREVWPAVAERLPLARLHVFGSNARDDRARAAQTNAGATKAGASIAWHAAPDDSRTAFDPRAILLLPMRHATGVRMRLLEAWARGVPAIATPAAVEGLDTADGRDVLIAADPRGFAEAAAALAADAGLRRRLIDGGRATLARHHDPANVARATLAAYREAIDRRASRRRHA
jgi:glycosyltransferase involved in cell wall biosynthesis